MNEFKVHELRDVKVPPSFLKLGNEHSDELDSFKVIVTMRSVCHIFGQVFTSCVFALMIPVHPQIVVSNIVNFALVGNVSWSTLFPVILFQFFQRELALSTFQTDPT